jgi:hypothetical protein
MAIYFGYLAGIDYGMDGQEMYSDSRRGIIFSLLYVTHNSVVCLDIRAAASSTASSPQIEI